MIQEITGAVVKAINDHQETFLAGLFGIGGTILGATGTLLVEWVRHSGKVSFAVIKSRIEPRATDSWSDHIPAQVDEAKRVELQIHFHVTNTFPDEKTLAVVAADFFPALKSKGEPILKAKWIGIGEINENAVEKEVALPRGGFKRFHVFGRADVAESARKCLAQAHALRITFIVAPAKKVYFWYPFNFDTDLNPDVVYPDNFKKPQ